MLVLYIYIYVCIEINCCCCSAYQEEEKFEAMSNKTRIIHVSVTAAPCLGWVSLYKLAQVGMWRGCSPGGSLGWGTSLPAKSSVCRAAPCCFRCRVSPFLPLPCSCIVSCSALMRHWDDPPTAPVWLSSLARGRSHVWRH